MKYTFEEYLSLELFVRNQYPESYNLRSFLNMIAKPIADGSALSIFLKIDTINNIYDIDYYMYTALYRLNLEELPIWMSVPIRAQNIKYINSEWNQCVTPIIYWRLQQGK